MAWTAPRTWVAGEIVTAALMNAHLRDNLLELGNPSAAWTTYTPSLAQNAALSTTTLTAEYSQSGKKVKGNVFALFSSAGTAASQLTANVPVGPRRNSSPFTIGAWSFRDVSTGTYYAGSVAFLGSGNAVRFIVNAQTDVFGITPAITVASGDIFSFSFDYEAA